MFFIGLHENRNCTESPLNRWAELVAMNYWYYRTWVVMGVYVNETPIFIGRNAPKTNYRINGTGGEGDIKEMAKKPSSRRPRNAKKPRFNHARATSGSMLGPE